MQTASMETDSPPPRKRTYADRLRKDKASTAVRWAGVTAKTREGRFIREVRKELIRHIGGNPSATQRVLIERGAMLTFYVARLDAKALARNTMSLRDQRYYLAWSNSLSRCLRDLGMRGAAQKPPDLATYLAAKSA